MSAPPLQAPAPPSAPDRAADGPRPTRPGPRVAADAPLTTALLVLLGAAVLPFSQIFTTAGWTRPVAGAVLLSCGIAVLGRRLDSSPVVGLLLSGAGLLVFTTAAFTPGSALLGIIPTPTSVGELWQLFAAGLELVESRPSPTFPDPGLVLLAVIGTWVIAYLADGLLFVIGTPLGTITAAVVLWVVPLAVDDDPVAIALPVAALLLGAGAVLLLGNAMTQASFGVRVGRSRHVAGAPAAGWVMLAAAIAVSLVAAPVVPGFEEEAVFRVTSGPTGGTTITTNPIVNIQDRLVAGDGGPVLRVTSPRPVYLRTTALDTFTAQEEWLLTGTISGPRADRGAAQVPRDLPVEAVDVEVEIAGIEAGAVLVPAPHLTTRVTEGRAGDMRYDATSATLTVPGAEPLIPGDRYVAAAALPSPTPDALRTVPAPSQSPFFALPDGIPAPVSGLARQLVDEAGAVTMFDQALALQDHLRGWSYSVTPTFGPGDTNLERFINGRQGYCEQFAGTMAVMLRTLGIPSRLAVGYTPGDLGPDGTWVVTNAHAHAWVEVDFGPYGWIAFEPTPRLDGNVLVPGASTVLPDQVAAAAPGASPTATPTPADGQATPTPTPADGATPSEAATPDGDQPTEPGAVAPGEVGAGGEGTSRRGPLVLLALLTILAGGLLVTRGRGSAAGHDVDDARRIAVARDALQRTAALAGHPRRPAETNDEYLHRLTGELGIGPPDHARQLRAAVAGAASRAEFAAAISPGDADAAEAAVHELRDVLVAGAGRGARVRMGLDDVRRGVAVGAGRLGALRRPGGQPSSPPRRPSR